MENSAGHESSLELPNRSASNSVPPRSRCSCLASSSSLRVPNLFWRGEHTHAQLLAHSHHSGSVSHEIPVRRSLRSESTLSLGKGRGEGGRDDNLRQKGMDRGIGSCYFIFLTFYFLNIAQVNPSNSERKKGPFIYLFIIYSFL